MNTQPLSYLENDHLKRIQAMGRQGRTFCVIILAFWLLCILGIALYVLGARTGLTRPATIIHLVEELPFESGVSGVSGVSTRYNFFISQEGFSTQNTSRLVGENSSDYNFFISQEGFSAPQGIPSWGIIVYCIGFAAFTQALWIAGVWMALGVFMEYSKGQAISHDAAMRIQWLGRILLIGGIWSLLLHLYFMVAQVISPLADSAKISLGEEKWLMSTLLGYFVLAVGRVMAQAVAIKAEQDLTI